MNDQPDYLQELDPTKTYIAWVKELKALPHLSLINFPNNVIMGLAEEMVDIIELSAAVKRLGYKMVPLTMDDPE